MTKIEWTQVLKQYLLKKTLLGVGFSLIGAGITIVASDGFWEFIIITILKKVVDPSDMDPLAGYRMTVSALLISLGLFCIIFWFIKERSKQFAHFIFDKYYLVTGTHNDSISLEEWENLQDPLFEFQIHFKVVAGNNSLYLHTVNIERCINKKPCLNRKPILKEEVPGSYWKGEPNANGIKPIYHEPYENWTDYHDIKIEAGSSKEFLYKRMAKAPLVEMFGAEITYGKGEYRIYIQYRFENENKFIGVEQVMIESYLDDLIMPNPTV
jgi:hypothetical protein